jgi:hypothetical protein
LIQPIEKSRIFAQSLLKIAPSSARFAMLGCYIEKNGIKIRYMKKVFMFISIAAMTTLFSSCATLFAGGDPSFDHH